MYYSKDYLKYLDARSSWRKFSTYEACYAFYVGWRNPYVLPEVCEAVVRLANGVYVATWEFVNINIYPPPGSSHLEANTPEEFAALIRAWDAAHPPRYRSTLSPAPTSGSPLAHASTISPTSVSGSPYARTSALSSRGVRSPILSVRGVAPSARSAVSSENSTPTPASRVTAPVPVIDAHSTLSPAARVTAPGPTTGGIFARAPSNYGDTPPHIYAYMEIQPYIDTETGIYLSNHYTAKTIDEMVDVLRAQGNNPNPGPAVSALEDIIRGKEIKISAAQYFYDRYTRALADRAKADRADRVRSQAGPSGST